MPFRAIFRQSAALSRFAVFQFENCLLTAVALFFVQIGSLSIFDLCQISAIISISVVSECLRLINALVTLVSWIRDRLERCILELSARSVFLRRSRLRFLTDLRSSVFLNTC